jgi:hypothetical protein
MKRSRIYETWLTIDSQPFYLKGVLYEVKDSSILISDSKLKQDYKTGHLKISEFYYLGALRSYLPTFSKR